MSVVGAGEGVIGLIQSPHLDGAARLVLCVEDKQLRLVDAFVVRDGIERACAVVVGHVVDDRGRVDDITPHLILIVVDVVAQQVGGYRLFAAVCLRRDVGGTSHEIITVGVGTCCNEVCGIAEEAFKLECSLVLQGETHERVGYAHLFLVIA